MKRSSNQPLNIILLGDPDAGKGTQAKLLVKQYGLYHFSSGAELRKLKTTNPTLGKEIKRTNDKGLLAPTKIVRQIMERVIFTTPKAKGIVFDGNPRMMGEARLYTKWLPQAGRDNPLVIYLSIPTAEMVKRTLARKARPEDTLPALKRRIAWHKKNVGDVFKFFSKRYTTKKISGIGTRLEVHKRIITEIKKYEARIH